MRFIKKATSFMTAAVLSFSAFGTLDIKSTVSEAAANTTIVNDTFWKDTNGNNIYSQGGGVFKFGDTYYWYGVHYSGAETYASTLKKNNDWGFVSVSCYSSKDLVNWKFENDVLTTKSKGMNWCYWFGRLGVAYCPKTKQYVLIAQHNEDVMFAQCSTPTGNFEVKNYQNQINGVLKAGTGDQTIFTDDDGNSYIICSNKGGRGHQYVVPLSDDYLSAGKAVEVAKGSGREGNCLFKYKGKYYFCASDLHGYNSSHTYYMVSDNLMGPYSSWKVMPNTDMDFSHVTQTGFFYTIKGSKQETVLFCGDRWCDFAGNGIGYNQWVPLSFNGTEPYFNSLSEWNLNDDTGEWSVGAGNNYILNPSFEADRVSQTTLAGWKASGTGNSNKNSGHTGNWSAQQWSDSAYKATLTQDVSLPNGTYTLKAYVRSTGGQNSAMIYVRGAGDDKIVNINKAMSKWTEIKIENIQVTNGKVQVGIYSDANAGNYVFVDDFSLVRSNGTAPPISQPDPIPDGKYIKSLTVNDTENYSDWSIQQNLQIGNKIFGDRDFTFTSLPGQLEGAERIQTACDSKNSTSDLAKFTAAQDMTVLIALDNRVENVPDWMSGFEKTSMTAQSSNDVTFDIYSKKVQANEIVTLGFNGQSAYCVNYVVFATDADISAIKGDVNADGKFDVSDVVMLQKWLLAIPNVTLNNWKAADLCEDGRLDVFDLCLMKRELVNQ